jgi:hypothetical protein
MTLRSVALTIAFLPAIAAAATLSSSSRIGPTGIGPIVFGMTPAQAATTGVKLIPYGAPASRGTCYYVRPDSPGGVDFMIESGTLRRVDVTSREIATTDGFRVGGSAARVLQFYGSRATLEPDKYDPAVRTIVVTPSGANADKFRLLFKIKKSAIVQIIAGLLPQVLYVERCG